MQAFQKSKWIWINNETEKDVYGELVAAMLAATTSDIEDIISGGLADIPSTSRLYEVITFVIEACKGGISQQKCFDEIHNGYDEYSTHG